MIGRPAAALTIRAAAEATARVVVQDGQAQGLQHDALGERAGHGQQRRVREVQLAFPVAVDVAAESVARQVFGARVVDDTVGSQLLDLVRQSRRKSVMA